MAVVQGTQFGTLETFTSQTNGSNSIIGDGHYAIVFQATGTTANAAALKIQLSVDGGTSWGDVASGTLTGVTSTTTPVLSITFPTGLYRGVTTSYTDGNVKLLYRLGPRI